MRLSLRLCLMVMLVLVTAGPHVLAQGDSSSVYTTTRPGGNTRGPLDWLLGRRAAPSANPAGAEQRARSYQPRKRTASAPRSNPLTGPAYGPPMPPELMPPPGEAPPQTADSAAPAAPPAPAQPGVSVAVVGDSLSVFLAQGLQELYADRPAVTFLRRHRESSGLVRDDYFDWPKALRDLTGGSEKIDALVLMIGSNDRQQLRDDAGVHDVRSEQWRALYAQRIDTVIGIAKAKNLPLIWVGLPVMRSERYSADLIAFNDLYKSRSAAAGIPYIDIWEAFAGEDGLYSVNGPDVGGDIVRLRTPDGVHFTKAGARKLAFFADKELQKIVAASQSRQQPDGPAVVPSQPPVAPDGGPLAMLPPQPDPRAPPRQPPSIDSLLGIVLPDQPLPSLLTPRPAQGSVVVLTAPNRTSGGALSSLQAPRLHGEPASVFVQGRPLSAKPGRLDDFRRLSE